MSNPLLYQQEVFGPSTIIVKCTDPAQFLQVQEVLGTVEKCPGSNFAEGQLTASFHAINSDCEKASDVSNSSVNKFNAT